MAARSKGVLVRCRERRVREDDPAKPRPSGLPGGWSTTPYDPMSEPVIRSSARPTPPALPPSGLPAGWSATPHDPMSEPVIRSSARPTPPALPPHESLSRSTYPPAPPPHESLSRSAYPSGQGEAAPSPTPTTVPAPARRPAPASQPPADARSPAAQRQEGAQVRELAAQHLRGGNHEELLQLLRDHEITRHPVGFSVGPKRIMEMVPGLTGEHAAALMEELGRRGVLRQHPDQRLFPGYYEVLPGHGTMTPDRFASVRQSSPPPPADIRRRA